MRKLLLLILIGLIVFVVVYRQRVFVWDPIAKATRDGAPVTGVKALINYSNDLLLEDSSNGHTRVYLTQNWNHTLAAPAQLRCLGTYACMTDADQATATPIEAGGRGRREPFQGVTMTNRRVEFVDEDGALVEVVMR